MFSALFANGPSLHPRADAPAIEWAVWGGCVSLAAILGGWALLNANRPKRDTLVGVALLGATILVAFATVFTMRRDWDREKERRNREGREQLDRMERETQDRTRERLQP